MKIFEEAVVKVEGHHQVSLHWQRNPADLKNNKSLEKSMLRQLKRGLKGDSDLLASNRNVMAGSI